MDFFPDYFEKIRECLKREPVESLKAVAELIRSTQERRGKVILVGNGGSAAMASHVAVDLTKVAGVRAIDFNEADLLTCLANDYGYEHWVEKALEFYGDEHDLVILISSSGKSANIVNGAKKARQLGMRVVTLSGFSAENPLRALGEVNLWVDSQMYNIIEMAHHIWLLAISDYCIASLQSSNRRPKRLAASTTV